MNILLSKSKGLLVVVLMVTLGMVLFGCSSESSETSSEVSGADTGAEVESENSSSEEGPAEFYEGAKINFIIPYDPGGGYDEYSRLIAPYIEKYTGATVELNNMSGAGGMRGVNELAASPDDGLTIAIINGSAMVTNELAEVKGAEYKLGEFGYLGRIVADPRVLTMGTDSPYQSFDDVINSNEVVNLGATGLGGSTYVDAVITGEALDINQDVTHGFDSSSIVEQAIQRGEVDGMWGSWGSRRDSVKNGLAKVVLQSGKERHPDLKDVPTYFEVAEKTEDPEKAKDVLTVLDSLNEVGRPIATTPGVPEDRLEFLQQAFDDAMNDPEFQEEAEKAGRALSFLGGPEMSEVAKNATDMPDDIKEIFVKAIKGEL